MDGESWNVQNLTGVAKRGYIRVTTSWIPERCRLEPRRLQSFFWAKEAKCDDLDATSNLVKRVVSRSFFWDKESGCVLTHHSVTVQKKTPPTGGVFFLSESLLRGLDGELYINVVARTGPLINGLLDLRRIGVLDLDGGGDGVDLTRLDLVLVLRLAVGQLDHGWQPFMCELVCTTVILRASGAWGQKLHDNLT